MSPIEVDVCIVGGGMSGLAAACALRKTGATVAVIERRMDGGDPHRGDLLRPRAVKILHALGAGLESRGVVWTREIVVDCDGREVVKRRLSEANPGASLSHPQIEAALRDAAVAAGVDVRAGWQLQLMLQDADGRVAGLTAVSATGGAEFRAKLVVGADGRSSQVREGLGLRQQRVDKAHSLLAVEADLPQGPKTPAPDRVCGFIGAEGGGLVVPLGGRRVRILAVTLPGAADTLAHLPTEELAAKLTQRGLLPAGGKLDPQRVRSYELTGSTHALNYVSRGAVCIGDAAHLAPIPSGEGMYMALLDAVALAKYAGPALPKGAKALAKALDRFERERWADNEARLAQARKIATWMLPLSRGRITFARTPVGRVALGWMIPTD